MTTDPPAKYDPQTLAPTMTARWFLAPFAFCLLALVPVAEAPCALLLGGRVIDGTGAPWFAADVGVRDGRIVSVRAIAEHDSVRTIDVRGHFVAPGFIDLLGQSEYNVLVDQRAASKITQGITTEVTGEGNSITPLNEAMLAEGADVYRRYGFVAVNGVLVVDGAKITGAAPGQALRGPGNRKP